MSVADRTIRVALTVALLFALAAWPMLSPRLPCAAVALLLTCTWMAVTHAAMEAAVLRRRAFIGFYLTTSGGLARLLRPRSLTWAWQGLKSLFLASLLLVGLLSLNGAQRAWLLLDPLLAIGLLSALRAGLARQLRAGPDTPLLRQWSHRLNALCIWFGLILTMQRQPDYAGLAWWALVRDQASHLQLQCDVFAMLGRIQVILETSTLWALENLLRTTLQPAQTATAWIVFAAVSGVSFLLAWTYSRALFGIWSRQRDWDDEYHKTAATPQS